MLLQSASFILAAGRFTRIRFGVKPPSCCRALISGGKFVCCSAELRGLHSFSSGALDASEGKFLEPKLKGLEVPVRRVIKIRISVTGGVIIPKGETTRLECPWRKHECLQGFLCMGDNVVCNCE